MDEPTDVMQIRPPLPGRKEFAQLVAKANDGDAQAVRELGHILDDCPKIWRLLGNLSNVAGKSFLRMAANGNRLVSGSISRYVRQLRKELEGPAPTPLECMAVERVLLAWTQAHYTDTMVMSLQTASPGTITMWLKRQSQAGRQFDAAIKSLATLRRLLPAAERASGKSRRA